VGDGGEVVVNVVFGSQSGSPGVSVWSVLVAGLWPSDDTLERVVVEADVDGGVMGARYRLDSKTDQLIAAAPRWDGEASSVDVAQFSARVSDRSWLVPGPRSPESASRLWRAADGARSVAALAAMDRRVWLFDVGRARPDGVLAPVFDEAACVVLFVRGAAEELAKVRSRLAALKRTGAHVMVAVTGSTDHGHAEVTEFLGSPHVHFLPDDGHLIDDSRQVWSGRRNRRRSVWAAGSSLAAAISEVLEYSPRGVMDVGSADVQ
jgi:hypothetical protein